VGCGGGGGGAIPPANVIKVENVQYIAVVAVDAVVTTWFLWRL